MPGIFIVLIPFSFIATGVHAGHQFSIIIASLAMIAGLIKSWPIKLFLWFGAGWCLMAQIRGLIHPFFLHAAQAAFGALVFLLVGACIYVSTSHSKWKTETFYNLICISAILQGVVGLCQLWGFFPVMTVLRHFAEVKTQIGIGPSTGIIGTLINPNFFAAYMVITAPFFMRKWWCLGLVLTLGLVAMEHTSTAVVALAVGSVYYFRNKWVTIGAIAGALAFVLHFDFKIFTVNARYVWWMDVIKRTAYPIWGMGPGTFTGYNFPIHSEWVELFYRYGLVGVSLAVAYMVSIFNTNRVLSTALVIAAVNCLGNYPMRLAPSAILIVVIMGLLERENVRLSKV